MRVLCIGAEPERIGQDNHAGDFMPIGLSDEHGEDMKQFLKELKTIWKDGDFTLILSVSLITYLLIEFGFLK